MHSTSKFPNNLRRDLGEEGYKIRHATVSDDQHIL